MPHCFGSVLRELELSLLSKGSGGDGKMAISVPEKCLHMPQNQYENSLPFRQVCEFLFRGFLKKGYLKGVQGYV